MTTQLQQLLIVRACPVGCSAARCLCAVLSWYFTLHRICCAAQVYLNNLYVGASVGFDWLTVQRKSKKIHWLTLLDGLSSESVSPTILERHSMLWTVRLTNCIQLVRPLWLPPADVDCCCQQQLCCNFVSSLCIITNCCTRGHYCLACRCYHRITLHQQWSSWPRNPAWSISNIVSVQFSDAINTAVFFIDRIEPWQWSIGFSCMGLVIVDSLLWTNTSARFWSVYVVQLYFTSLGGHGGQV